MARMKGKTQTAAGGGTAGPSDATQATGSASKSTPGVRGGRLKRSARKSVFLVVFTDSDTEEEVDLVTYRELRKEWKRLRCENREMKETAEAHVCELEKAPLVCGLRSEVKHVRGLLGEANVVIEGLHKDAAEARRLLADSETQLAALRAGWKKRLDELITRDLRIGSLEERVDRLLTEVVPHVYQTSIVDLDAGKRLVELAASPNVKIQDLVLMKWMSPIPTRGNI